jgi:hypothetical protein
VKAHAGEVLSANKRFNSAGQEFGRQSQFGLADTANCDNTSSLCNRRKSIQQSAYQPILIHATGPSGCEAPVLFGAGKQPSQAAERNHRIARIRGVNSARRADLDEDKSVQLRIARVRKV